MRYLSKHFIATAGLLLCAAFAHAQVVEGIIKDAKTNDNLPYVNVKGHTTDTVKISMIGYRPVIYITGSFTTGKTILLQPEAIQLNEVKVHNKKWKTGILGIVRRSESSNVNFGSNRLGNELAALIKIKKSPTVIKKFNAFLTAPTADSVKLRLNFYSVKNGLPGDIVQQQNIFVTVAKGQQMIDIDLEPYNVIIEDDFFASLEWIQTTKGRGLSFAGRPFRGSVYVREISQDGWVKSGWLGLGFNVTAEW
jgi:hypothetical protein